MYALFDASVNRTVYLRWVGVSMDTLIYMSAMERHPERAQQQPRILVVCSRGADMYVDFWNHPRRISMIRTLSAKFPPPFPPKRPFTSNLFPKKREKKKESIGDTHES